MGSRSRTTTLRCTWPDCRETSLYEYDNQREYAEIHARRTTHRCLRHRNDLADVLAQDNRAVSTELVIVQKDHGRFWGTLTKAVQGLVTGPGFQAWARDFPVGTRLRITAEVYPCPHDSLNGMDQAEGDGKRWECAECGAVGTADELAALWTRAVT